MSGPLIIGGTGGCGTRVVARIVLLSGRYMGADRNGSEDAMPLARFDWEWGLPYLESGRSPQMARSFEATLAEHLAGRKGEAPWGWKHPHSYLLLPFLRERFPEMRFIHVIRDGRDTALSSNKNQVRRYGALLRRPAEPEAVLAAAWWEWANLRARADAEPLGDRRLLVRFEDLCADPTAGARRIAEFSAPAPLTGPAPDLAALAAEVEPPASIGRRRRADPALMREVEAACVGGLRAFGYA